jgi:hypothetical protein
VIVVNTTFRLAPWADVLFAMDKAWWDQYGAEARRDFAGSRTSTFNAPGVEWVRKLPHFSNSGAAAIALAAKLGARRVLMLGYDCQKTGGKVHWHGDHPKGLGNAGAMPKWPGQFAKLKAAMAGVEIINCSRATALTCFTRGDLEKCLAESAT